MQKFRFILLTVLVCAIVFSSFGCGKEPEYMHPYGEGVDPDTVTTRPFQTRTTTTSTTTKTTADNDSATTKPITEPTQISATDIPENCVICPDCDGVKIICEYCFGTNKVKAEIFDADSGVYVRKYVSCDVCSDEDPGYMFCDTCKNLLYIIPEKEPR